MEEFQANEDGLGPLAGPTSKSAPALPSSPSDSLVDKAIEPIPNDVSSSHAQRTVPYGALAEERARRKELQRELQNTIESQQRLQGRLDLLHDLAQQQGAVDAGPDVETMPEHEGDPSHGDSPSEMPIPDVDPQAGAQFRTQVMHSVRDVMHERLPGGLSACTGGAGFRAVRAGLCAAGGARDHVRQ
jgi:hypothetical protein